MFQWSSLLLPSVLCALLVYLPGLLVAASVGLKGLWSFAAAPIFSVAMIAGSAVVLGFAGVPWNVFGVALSTVAAAIALAAVRFSVLVPTVRHTLIELGARQKRFWTFGWVRSPAFLAGCVGMVSNALVFVVQFVRPVQDPQNYGQLQDTMFHFNVVRFILDTSNGSSLHSGLMDGSADPSPFYPSAWHDIVALVVQSSGVSIPLATNALTAILLVLVFPLGSMALAVTLFGRRPTAVLAALVLSTAFVAFPWKFLTWGLLYSNQLGGTLVTGLLALIVVLSESGLRGINRAWALSCVGVLAFAALALAQPNTLFGMAVYLLPFGYFLVWRLSRGVEAPARRRVRYISYFALSFVAVVSWLVIYNLPFMKRTVTWVWPPFQSPSQAFGEVAFNGYNGSVGQLLLSLLVIAGVVAAAARARNYLWLVAAYGGFAFLYIAASGSNGYLRDILTGFWYHDSNRLAAFAATAAVPLAVLGVLAIFDALRPSLTRLRFGPAVPTMVVLAVVLTNLLGPAMKTERGATHAVFDQADGQMLTTAERSFLRKVSEVVPKNAVVANNPYDGSALGYAFYGIKFLFPAMDGNWMGRWDPEKHLIAERLDQAASDPAVCRALSSLHVDYAVQLENKLYAAGGEKRDWKGLRIAPGTAGFERVMSDGPMVLYRVTPCS